MKFCAMAWKARMVLAVALMAALALSVAPESAGILPLEDSAFGIFAGYAVNEFGYFKQRAGFSDEDYWRWADEHFKKLGAHWTRSNLQLVWDIIEPVSGAGYRWDNPTLTDPMIKRIYIPGNQVHWLGVFHEGGGPLPPRGGMPPLRNPLDYPEQYKAFVRAVVERYDGDGIGDAAPGVKVKYWQAGNEVSPWRDSGRTVQDYIQYVRMVREAVKEADPEAKIVLIAPTDGFVIDPFLVQVIDTLAAEHAFDAIDVHHWGTAQNWQMPAIPQYRQLLDSRGLSYVQIWSCEHGTWQGQPFGEPAQTEQDQARSLIKRYVYHLNNGLNKLFWNNLMEWHQFAGQPGSIFNSMGLVTDGQGPGEDPARFNTERVAYWAYKMLAEKIDTHIAKQLGPVREIFAEGRLYAYAYQRHNDGRKFYILWSEVGSQQVALSVGSPKVHMTNMITDRFGRVLQAQDLSAQDGRVALTAGADPLLVEEAKLAGLTDQVQTEAAYVAEPVASLTAGTLKNVYFQIALNINYSHDPVEQSQIIQTIRRHLDLMSKHKIKANYYFTGLAAQMTQRLDPALIELLKEKSEAKLLTLGHHGANRPPHPMPIERVKGQNWEEDVKAILDYESCALDPATGRLDCARPGGLKNMIENIFTQPLFSTGRFFQASILYVTKLFGVKMAVGLQDNTGAPRGDAWFLGILNRPDGVAIGPEIIVRWAQGGSSPLSGLEQRIATLDKSRIRLVSLLVHDTDFSRGRSPAQEERIWQKYEEVITWALSRGYKIVSLKDLYDTAVDDHERTITKSELQTIAEFYIKQVENSSPPYPPDYIDLGDDYFSLADAWQALAQALAHYQQTGSLPDQVFVKDILGPTVLVKLETIPRTISPEDILRSTATSLAKPVDRVPSLVKLEQARIEINASEHLYLMAKEFLSLLSGSPTAIEVFKISLISKNVEAIRSDPNDPRNELADPLTKQQFWTFKPVRWK